MKFFSRRGFTKAAPMATVATITVVGQGGSGGGMAQQHVKMPYLAPGMNTAEADTDPLYHIKRQKVKLAEEYIRNASLPGRMYERVDTGTYNSINLNIMSLRSVSAQHKIHMHIVEMERQRQEKLSFVDKVCKMFGLEGKDDLHVLY